MSTRSLEDHVDKLDLRTAVYPPSTASTSAFPDATSSTPGSLRSFVDDSAPTTPGPASPSIRDDQEVILALPPVDEGYAWVFLACGFFIGGSCEVDREKKVYAYILLYRDLDFRVGCFRIQLGNRNH